MGGFAWVTLATNDSYSLGALVLAHSLRQVGTRHQIVVLVTPGVTNAMREKLGSVFNLVQEVNVLDSKDEANLRLLQRPELGITFTKLHCWRLAQFEKCVFLDADTLVLENADELFEREEFSAAPDVGWPDCFNSGVFVYRPSNETYEKIVNFALEKGSFDGGDQGLLNLFFADWAHKDISKHLPFIYNMSSTATYSYLPAFKQFGRNAKIVHFIGATKPWLQYFDTETRQVQASSGLQHMQPVLQHWWNIFFSLIHPNLSTEMAGLAGAFAQLKLGQPRTPGQVAYEDHLRRQGWEAGNIDYLGRDSFDNIWKKICQTLEAAAATTPEPVAEKPAEATTTTVPKEKESIPVSTEKPADTTPQTQPTTTPTPTPQTLDTTKAPEVAQPPPAQEPPTEPPEAPETAPAEPPKAPETPAVAPEAAPAEVPPVSEPPKPAAEEPPKTPAEVPKPAEPVVCELPKAPAQPAVCELPTAPVSEPQKVPAEPETPAVCEVPKAPAEPEPQPAACELPKTPEQQKPAEPISTVCELPKTPTEPEKPSEPSKAPAGPVCELPKAPEAPKPASEPPKAPADPEKPTASEISQPQAPAESGKQKEATPVAAEKPQQVTPAAVEAKTEAAEKPKEATPAAAQKPAEPVPASPIPAAVEKPKEPVPASPPPAAVEKPKETAPATAEKPKESAPAAESQKPGKTPKEQKGEAAEGGAPASPTPPPRKSGGGTKKGGKSKK